MGQNSSTVEIEKPKAFCFLGLKPNELGGFGESKINDWVRFSLKLMISHLAVRHDKLAFLCGAQPGTELWAAEEVLHLQETLPNISLSIILPFPNITGRQVDGTPLFSKPWPMSTHRRLMKVVEKAGDVHTVSEGPYAAWRVRARDEWVIDNSDGVLLVLNEEKANLRIDKIKERVVKAGKQLCIIDPSTERIYTV